MSDFMQPPDPPEFEPEMYHQELEQRIATLEAELAYERMTPVERTEYVKAQNAAITQEVTDAV